MKTIRHFTALAILALSRSAAAEDWIERIDDYLAVSAFHGNVRARFSGLIDLEGYYIQQPAPGLIDTDNRGFLNPRLTMFLDAQIGPNIYAFIQSRVDRGFDPGERDADVRLDEYAIRISPWEDGRLSLQAGKFATVVGNWAQRHDSWTNPFVTAPLPYENVTGIWDSYAVPDADVLLDWSHVPEPGTGFVERDYSDKFLRNPIIWGPSYTSGLAVFGKIGKVEYAADFKNAGLASRPESWDVTEIGFEHPSFSGRLGFRPNQTWNFGISASSGAYLIPDAAPSLPPGKDIGDYRELVLAQDISFEWHHWQVWAEFYETRFEVPGVGNADTFAYYLEAKYKFTPQLFGALRWNQQLFDTVRYDGDRVAWGNDRWRIDAALACRLSAHLQLKAQYSLDHEDHAPREFSHNISGQFTVRF